MRGCGAFELITPMRLYSGMVRERDVHTFDVLMRRRKKSNKVNGSDPLAPCINVQTIQWSRGIDLGHYKARQYFPARPAGNIIRSITVFSFRHDH